jgi:DNA-binding HxlR family transcriptional regulator
VRAGIHALSLLSVPLNVQVVRSLEEGPLSLTDLRRRTGSPPQTTLRTQTRMLARSGIVERREQQGFPGGVEYELTRAGDEFAWVADRLQSWLDIAPDGPMELGEAGARGAIKALIGGWSSAIVRALAARPLALTELDRLISNLNYPSLERRLGAMRLVGQLERCEVTGRGTPYRVTAWLRQGTAPILSAALWERRHRLPPDLVGPMTRLDAEAAFLLMVPTLTLAPGVNGRCRLVVELRRGVDDEVAGVLLEVMEGRVVSCVSDLKGEVDAWLAGSTGAWLRSIVTRDRDQLEPGGDAEFAWTVLRGIKEQGKMALSAVAKATPDGHFP